MQETHNQTEVEVYLHHRTDDAVLVSLDGDRKKAVWVPKAVCEFTPGATSSTGVLTLSERLATKKGLV